ncbi:major vault protein-like [Haliotis asinina]|uniref:major vault protein-like n=1 Tax=Haliotis asinina TaxID=109174 RepID=UPI003531C180
MSHDKEGGITGLMPYQYVHVLDLTTNITRLEVGPQTLVLKSNERLEAGPLPMIVVPPGHYISVTDPVSHYEAGKACELKLGQKEVRLHQDPFPLYPGESLTLAPEYVQQRGQYQKAVRPLPVIKANHAIRLRALLDLEDSGVKRKEEEMWQLPGPLTYIPRADVEVVKVVQPFIIRNGDSLNLRAIQDCYDNDGNKRVTGEEWLVSTPGAYVPGVFEEVLGVKSKITLTHDAGLHLRATRTLTDAYGDSRLAGDEWLLTGEETDSYFPEVGVEVVKQVKKTVVSKGQYCVVLDPVDEDKRPCLGKRVLKKGLCTFFLHPGERLEDGIQNSHVLSADESLVLQATGAFTDDMFKGKPKRKPGDLWLIRGPLEYIPPIEVEIVKKRETMPLSKNEGIYVQNRQTGKIRSVMGPCSYMLNAHEELWEKPLTPEVEEILRNGGGIGDGNIRKLAYYEQSINPSILMGRNRTKIVTYRCPGNTAVQVYNYMQKTARVVLGPDLIILGPHENFNVLSLSAGKPKKANALKSLCMMLGPDFITDILEVETADHARLKIQIAFNNHFEYYRNDDESLKQMFAVPDFIGFACRQVGSRIRGAVALVPFDEFHRHSLQIIRTAVFGINPVNKQLRTHIRFSENNLVITNIDVQSIEPSDVKMRDSLSKSIQMAIEIATRSIENAAAHEADKIEQAARGQLERQKLANEKDAEKERANLLHLCAIAAAVESTGQAKAEAQAQAERMLIECQSEIEAAKLKAEAEAIEHQAKLETQSMVRRGELNYLRGHNELYLDKERRKAEIEVNKFQEMIESIGQETCAAMAQAGPDTQIRLLQALGMQSVLFTDAKNPLNLFNTAGGPVGMETDGQASA